MPLRVCREPSPTDCFPNIRGAFLEVRIRRVPKIRRTFREAFSFFEPLFPGVTEPPSKDYASWLLQEEDVGRQVGRREFVERCFAGLLFRNFNFKYHNYLFFGNGMVLNQGNLPKVAIIQKLYCSNRYPYYGSLN